MTLTSSLSSDPLRPCGRGALPEKGDVRVVDGADPGAKNGLLTVGEPGSETCERNGLFTSEDELELFDCAAPLT